MEHGIPSHPPLLMSHWTGISPTQRDPKVPHSHSLRPERFSSLFGHFKGSVKHRKFTDFFLLAMPWQPIMEEEIKKSRGWGRLMSRKNWTFMDPHWAEQGFVCYLDSWVKHTALCLAPWYCYSLLRPPSFTCANSLCKFFFTWNKIVWFGVGEKKATKQTQKKFLQLKRLFLPLKTQFSHYYNNVLIWNGWVALITTLILFSFLVAIIVKQWHADKDSFEWAAILRGAVLLPSPQPHLPYSWQRKQVAASSRLFLSFLFVTGVSVSNICWPELASSCCAGLWQGRAEEPGPCAKHGAWLCRARPESSRAVPAIAGHGLRAPGRGCSAPPAFSGPSSHKWQGCCFFSLWIMNVILSKIAKGDKQINMGIWKRFLWALTWKVTIN